jgi:hypothetical protein
MPKFPSARSAPISGKFDQLFGAAELLIRVRFNTPALILIYSSIDAASWLSAEDPDGHVQTYFVNWVEKYLPTDRFNCSSLELWAARNGIVHTLSASSRLTRRGKARPIIYVNRGGDREILERLETIRTAKNLRQIRDSQRGTDDAGMSSNVIVEVDALLNGVREGVTRMLNDAKTDPLLKSRIEQRESNVLATISDRRAGALLEWAEAMAAVAEAPERHLFDLPYQTDCSGCEDGIGRVLVRAIGDDGKSIATLELCDRCADALGGQGLIRDSRNFSRS